MEAIRSSETLVLTNNTRRKIPEDCLLHYLYCLQPVVYYYTTANTEAINKEST
jgi:hypothetical protein